MHQLPTRSVNGGCVIMVVGLLALAFGLLGCYAIWKAGHSAHPEEYKDLVRTLTWNCVIAIVLGLTLIILGWRFAKRVRGFDPNDPDEPMMKF